MENSVEGQEGRKMTYLLRDYSLDQWLANYCPWPNLTQWQFVLFSLKAKNGFYTLIWLHFKWLYKYWHNILDFALT